jgi:hypothetical protein
MLLSLLKELQQTMLTQQLLLKNKTTYRHLLLLADLALPQSELASSYIGLRRTVA